MNLPKKPVNVENVFNHLARPDGGKCTASCRDSAAWPENVEPYACISCPGQGYGTVRYINTENVVARASYYRGELPRAAAQIQDSSGRPNAPPKSTQKCLDTSRINRIPV